MSGYFSKAFVKKGGFSVLTVSETAKEKFKEFLTEENNGSYIRIYVSGMG